MPQPHPLFPDKGPLDISWIGVTRHEASGQVWCPVKFDPEELQSLEHIHELFGGGVYEFIARDEKGILARHKVKLPGPSKPLAPTADPAPVSAPVQVQSSGGGSDGILLQLLMGMMSKSDAQAQATLTMQQQMMQSMAQMFASQAAQQTQFLTAMMQDSKRDSQAFVTGMAELAKAQTATMAEAMKASGGGGGSKDDALEALTTGFELGRANNDRPNEVAETIGAVVQGIGALKDQKSANGAS